MSSQANANLFGEKLKHMGWSRYVLLYGLYYYLALFISLGNIEHSKDFVEFQYINGLVVLILIISTIFLFFLLTLEKSNANRSAQSSTGDASVSPGRGKSFWKYAIPAFDVLFIIHLISFFGLLTMVREESLSKDDVAIVTGVAIVPFFVIVGILFLIFLIRLGKKSRNQQNQQTQQTWQNLQNQQSHQTWGPQKRWQDQHTLQDHQIQPPKPAQLIQQKQTFQTIPPAQQIRQNQPMQPFQTIPANPQIPQKQPFQLTSDPSSTPRYNPAAPSQPKSPFPMPANTYPGSASASSTAPRSASISTSPNIASAGLPRLTQAPPSSVVPLGSQQASQPQATDKPSLNVQGIIYKFLSVMGEGGMGRIFLGQNSVTGRLVAIKEFFPQSYVGPSHDGVKNECEFYWNREFEIMVAQAKSPIRAMQPLGALKRPAIRDPRDTEYYLIIEFIKGVTLDKWVKDHIAKVTNEVILLRLLAQIFLPVCGHLYYTHSQGIVHRDVTPKNIMVMDDPSGGVPILIDWGMAKQLPANQLFSPPLGYIEQRENMATGIHSVGNPPEVLAGLEPLAASDVYMMGHILFFLLMGGQYAPMPVIADDYTLHIPANGSPLLVRLNTLLEWMTRYEPARRPNGFGEVLTYMAREFGLSLPVLSGSGNASTLSSGNPEKRI